MQNQVSCKHQQNYQAYETEDRKPGSNAVQDFLNCKLNIDANFVQLLLSNAVCLNS